jgi:hypothetical protein
MTYDEYLAAGIRGAIDAAARTRQIETAEHRGTHG